MSYATELADKIVEDFIANMLDGDAVGLHVLCEEIRQSAEAVLLPLFGPT
jgi:hypothetical protein